MGYPYSAVWWLLEGLVSRLLRLPISRFGFCLRCLLFVARVVGKPLSLAAMDEDTRARMWLILSAQGGVGGDVHTKLESVLVLHLYD